MLDGNEFRHKIGLVVIVDEHERAAHLSVVTMRLIHQRILDDE